MVLVDAAVVVQVVPVLGCGRLAASRFIAPEVVIAPTMPWSAFVGAAFVGGEDGTVWVWDLVTGQHRLLFRLRPADRKLALLLTQRTEESICWARDDHSVIMLTKAEVGAVKRFDRAYEALWRTFRRQQIMFTAPRRRPLMGLAAPAADLKARCHYSRHGCVLSGRCEPARGDILEVSVPGRPWQRRNGLTVTSGGWMCCPTRYYKAWCGWVWLTSRRAPGP
jgi:hypothetical protein